MIAGLTPKDEDLLEEYEKKWEKVILTTLTDTKKSEEETIRIYDDVGLYPPKRILWGRSPLECLQIIQVMYDLVESNLLTENSIYEELQKRKSSKEGIKISKEVANIKAFDRIGILIPLADFLLNEKNSKPPNLHVPDHVSNLFKYCSGLYPMKEVAVLCEKPVEINYYVDVALLTFSDGFSTLY